MINQLMTQLKIRRSQKSINRAGWQIKTGCLLDFSCFEKNYRLIAPDLSKQKALDADSRAIQQFIFKGKIKSTVANTSVRIYYVLEQSKRNNPTIL